MRQKNHFADLLELIGKKDEQRWEDNLPLPKAAREFAQQWMVLKRVRLELALRIDAADADLEAHRTKMSMLIAEAKPEWIGRIYEWDPEAGTMRVGAHDGPKPPAWVKDLKEGSDGSH